MATTGVVVVLGLGVLRPNVAGADEPAANLSITETPPATSPVAGTTADWVFTVANAGPSQAVNVHGSDTLTEGLTFVSSSPAVCSSTGGVVSCDLPTLDAGTAVPITVTLKLDPAVPAGAVLYNTETVTSQTPDPDLADNTYGPVTSPPVVTQADLSWTMTASPPADGVLNPGDSFDYTLAVTNHGPSNARGVAVTDRLPGPLSFVSSTSGCTATGQDVACPTVASMAPGTTRSFTFTVKLDPGYTGDGSDLGNSGTVVSTTPPPPVDPTPPPPPTPAPRVSREVTAGLKFVPVDPVRVLDTRDGTGGVPSGKVAGGGTVSFPVMGGQVPAEARAVALNVTTTSVAGPGYATVWPHGEAMPATSSVNVSEPDETAANAAVVPVGQGGMLDMFTFESAHLVADLTGYWVSAGSTVDGRLQSVSAPTRLLDSRDGTGGKSGGAFAAGEQFDLQVTGSAVPAGATAAVMTVTYTNPTAPGYLTLWPSGSARPVVSTTNPNGSGDIRSNLAIVKIGAAGQISVFSYQPSDVVIDVVGYFGNDPSGRGLFTPMSPHRIEDSRQAGQAFGRIGAGETATLPFDKLVPPAATTVIYNLTATQTVSAGFLTAFANGQPRPLASSVNWSGPDQSRAAFNGSALGAGRAVNHFAYSDTDVIIDLAGWFT
jgi:uncharacterized repeat protein (TIGR01451 family)